MEDLTKLTTEQLKQLLTTVKAFAFTGTYGSKPAGSETLAKLFKERQRIHKELKRREQLDS